jgi:hypothetical protein
VLLTLSYLLGSARYAADAHRPFSLSGTLRFCNALLAGLLWIGTRSGLVAVARGVRSARQRSVGRARTIALELAERAGDAPARPGA